MTAIYLYSGAANPNDIILRDPTVLATTARAVGHVRKIRLRERDVWDKTLTRKNWAELQAAIAAEEETRLKAESRNKAKERKPLIAAANAAVSATDPLQIPAKTTAYSFRHTRISELLQVYKIDANNVCKETGTSLVMLHEHYHHLIREELDQALNDERNIA